jgi:hypothetical protein
MEDWQELRDLAERLRGADPEWGAAAAALA